MTSTTVAFVPTVLFMMTSTHQSPLRTRRCVKGNTDYHYWHANLDEYAYGTHVVIVSRLDRYKSCCDVHFIHPCCIDSSPGKSFEAINAAVLMLIECAMMDCNRAGGYACRSKSMEVLESSWLRPWVVWVHVLLALCWAIGSLFIWILPTTLSVSIM